MSKPWKAVLEGKLRQEALDTVARMVVALEPFAGERGPKTGLLSGQAGLALFFHAAERAGLVKTEGLVDRCMEVSLDEAANQSLDASLEAGLSGIGFALTLLTGDASAADSVDEILLTLLSGEAKGIPAELAGGLVGFGVHALERGEAGAPLLNAVVRHLGQSLVADGDGLHLRHARETLDAETRATWPDGVERFGLAHGVAGVLGLLAVAAPQSPEAGRLVEPVTRALLAGRNPDLTFPDGLTGKKPVKFTDYEGWCNGTPGVVAALSLALEVLPAGPTAELAKLCLEAGVRMRRPVDDAILCHGTAGNGSIMLRVHQRTPSADTEAAAHFWVEETLKLRRPDGLGGFLAYRPWLEAPHWAPDHSLGVGTAGVGLFLLAAATDDEPRWDRSLMLS